MDITRSRRRNKVVDMSCFLLFEATGDSESGCNFDPAMADHINHIEDVDDDDDHDDAESCSSSTSTAPAVRGRKIYSLEMKFGNISGDVHDYDDDDDDDDDDDGVVEQKDVNLYTKCCRDDQRINGVVAAKEKKPSSSSAVPIENPKETMNEMETNKLFWEACLAS